MILLLGLIPFLAPAAMAGPIVQAPTDTVRARAIITRPGDAIPAFELQWQLDPLDPARTSPKKFGVDRVAWEFPWVVSGYALGEPRRAGLAPPKPQYPIRFRVYSQERKEHNDQAIPVMRMLLSLWDEAHTRLNYDHSEQYENGIVDVFLCWGGKPGGEQRYDIATEGKITKPVDTIYIYDTNSFTVPIEMAREVAHEYGHALLPAIGGYYAPENWANGYLGEKLFLSWIRDGLQRGKLTLEDTLGATLGDLKGWVSENVDPLILRAAQTFPSRTYLDDKTAVGMSRYIGLALYADAILPETVFGRSMRLTGSTDAVDYPDAIVLATEEPENYDLRIPDSLVGKSIWVPIGKGLLTGAKILQFHGAWAQIIAPNGPVHVVNRKQ